MVRFWPHLRAFPTIWRRSSIANTVLLALEIIACFLVAAGRLPEFQALIYLLLLMNFVALALWNFAWLLLTSQLGDSRSD